MAFFNFLNPVFDALFQPLLAFGPFWFVLILSTVLSLVIVVVYKYATDQDLMKRLKSEMDELRAEMKTLRDDKEKMIQVNQRFMQTNMKYIMQSFKASLFTILPIILIYAYLNGAIAFEPIVPNEEFSVSLFFDEGVAGNVSASAPAGVGVTGGGVKEIARETIFTFKGEPGEYLLRFDANGHQYDHEVLVKAEGYGYAEQVTDVSDGSLGVIQTNMDKLVVLNLFGWELGWFGTYIIISIIGSILFRRLLNVY